jgi:uncharacterized small protein (DUF1192 family)
MTRKLLPYEYELIDVLGVSKEEYLDFVAQQHIYKDIKEGSALDTVNGPLTPALVLAIIGVVLQVVSILLMPKPNIPGQEGSPQTRDQRLAPRTGFNGAQELAVYGEPVPLIYTSMNDGANGHSAGGVRVATLLLWSAILSFGSSQFMRLMMTIGASTISSIDPDRTAIGQLPAKDIVLSNAWQYFNANGPTVYANLVSGTANTDPTGLASSQGDNTAKLNGLPGLREGFSQCFSPSTANAVGVTGFIPVNADVLTLNESGDRVRTGTNVQYTPQQNSFALGNAITVNIPNTTALLETTDTPGIATQDARRASASMFDNGAIFKTGSALFRVASLSYSNNGSSIDEGDLTVRLECVRAGSKFSVGYNTTHYLERTGSVNDTNQRIANLEAELNQINAPINPASQAGRAASRGLFPKILGPRGYSSIRQTIAQPLTSLPLVNTFISQRYYQSGGGGNQYRVYFTPQQLSALQHNRDMLLTRRDQIPSEIRALEATLNEKTVIAVAPFYAKGFARIEQASYSSVTKCNVLDLALKCDIYRRISGRNNVYGKEQRNYGHSPSDNGAKPRTAMFRVQYRFDRNAGYATIPFIFCVRGLNEQSVFTYLKLACINNEQFIEARLEPVIDPPTESNVKGFCYLAPNGALQELTTAQTDNAQLQVFFNGSQHGRGSGYPPINRSPKDTSEFDLFNYDAYTTSAFAFDNGPEIKITAVNEQTIEPWSTYSTALYTGLSNFALHIHSGPGTQDVRDVSVWVSEGKKLRPLDANNPSLYDAPGEKDALAASAATMSSSYAPDIFLDTILDDTNGIGKFASLHSVDVQQLAFSKKFCQANQLFMDGLIGDARSWREFWAQTAPFSLLELGKIGGMETLIPAVHYNKTTGAIDRAIPINALFNQGNILEGTYKEEFIDYGSSTQDVIVTVIYRDVETNGIFPRNNSVEVKLTNTNEDNAIRETIDTSQFVTTRRQAVILGKFLCQTRRHTRQAVEFQTFPTDSFIMPGGFIYVETSNNQWDGIYTGRVEAGGALNLPIASTVPNGTYNVLTYGSTDGTRSFTDIAVSNNTATSLASVAGQLFVLGTVVRSKRVFRIVEVTMEEEGETTVRAVEHPCDASGNSLIAEGLTVTNSGLFTVDGTAG